MTAEPRPKACVILGAGASNDIAAHGAPVLDKAWQPPLAKQLFGDLPERGYWCDRTGKRYRTFAIPLYRLRSALSRLWLNYPPSPKFTFQFSG